METKYYFSPTAYRNLKGITDNLSRESDGETAQKLIDEIIKAVETTGLPLGSTKKNKKYLKAIVCNYLIVYRVCEDSVMIDNIHAAKRKK